MTVTWPAAEEADHWWITTGVETMNGRKVLGPFESSQLAMKVRTFIEKVEGHQDYWVERLVPVDRRVNL